ncbi:MAG: rRNA maturation RNase YbeY [Bacteroidota bacterium]
MISFDAYEIDFTLSHEFETSNWIEHIIHSHGMVIHQLSFIFCSDAYLLKLNRQYLSHDYYTDILTFPYHEDPSKGLWSDIYISIARIKENAESFQKPFEEELHRVIIHGVLHLLGYDDHGENESLMREKEDWALKRRVWLDEKET